MKRHTRECLRDAIGAAVCLAIAAGAVVVALLVGGTSDPPRERRPVPEWAR
jgi:hypothetical protein